MTNRSHTRYRMEGNNPLGATCIALCAAIVAAGIALAGCGEREGQVPPDAARTSAQLSERSSFSEGGGEAMGVGEASEDPEGSAAEQNGPEQPASGDPGALARQELGTLQIKGRAPKQGYSRDQFGQRWKDIDHNGCDQRNDVLARDLQDVDAPGGCKVLSGVLHDPYTGQTINFVRGQETSALVQIDHVVAMADAWQKGAQGWTPERREEFGNDLENLLAVDGPQNQKKGAGDAATWLPPNKNFRCQYVSRQIHVKAKYGLWVTPAEHDAMIRELDQC
ncbi:HNH endonuclease family protein [Corynebacterium anserum]